MSMRVLTSIARQTCMSGLFFLSYKQLITSNQNKLGNMQRQRNDTKMTLDRRKKLFTSKILNQN